MSFPGLLLLAPAVACLLSWLGVGAAIPRRFLTGEILLDTVTRIGVGSAVLSLVLFGLGRVGLLDHWVIVGITLALAVPGAWLAAMTLAGVLRGAPEVPQSHPRGAPEVPQRNPTGTPEAGRRRLPRLSTAVWVLLALGLAALALDLVASTAPPTSPDALRYHLGLPKQWLVDGWIDDSFWRYESFNPLGTQVLFAQGLALGGGGAAGAVGAIMAALGSVAVFGLARELGAGDMLAAAIGFALFSLQGMLTWLATSSFAEPGLAFYSIAAVWHAARYIRARDTPSLVGAGLLAGAAAGTKYLGLVSAALVLAPLALVALRAGRGRAVAGALALAGLIALPWYVRNLIETGNPVYPLILGGKFVEAGDSSRLREGLGATSTSYPLLRLPILPIELVLRPDAYAKGRYIGMGIFLAAPFALFGPGARLHRILFAGSIVFIAVCVGTVPSQSRFLLPALGVLAALGGVGIAGFVRRHAWSRYPLAAAAATVAVLWLLPSTALTRQLLPVAFGLESRTEFIQRVTGVQDLLDRVDRRATGTVAFADYTSIFNYPGSAIALDRPEFDRELTRATYLERLRSHDVTEVLTPELDLTHPSSLPEGRVQEIHNLAQELEPLDPCLEHVATYDVGVVVSRSRGAVDRIRFGLLSLARCYRSLSDPTDARSSTSSTAAPSSRYSSSVLTDQTS